MNKHIALAIAALGVSVGAQAGITVSSGSLGPSFITLTQGGNVIGGAVYYVPNNIDLPPVIAAIPFQDNTFPTADFVTDHVKGWIGAGPAVSQPSPAKLSFGAGVTAVSFLWGSADDYNSFKVVTSQSAGIDLTAASVATASGAPLGGNQNTATYVRFSTNSPGETISSIWFQSTSTNAIEISNVTVVPEPEAFGLALAGMGVVAFAMRRRRAG